MRIRVIRPGMRYGLRCSPEKGGGSITLIAEEELLQITEYDATVTIPTSTLKTFLFNDDEPISLAKILRQRSK